MKTLKNCAPSVALSCLLLSPVSGQAASWTAPGGSGDYEIKDTTNGTTPLTIKAATPSDSLFLDNTGNLGLGGPPRRVAPPNEDFSPRFYIADPTPDIEFDDIDDPQIWQIFADGGNASQSPPPDELDTLGGIGFFDQTAGSNGQVPFFVQSGAPTASLYIKTNGYMGVGTFDPKEQLHVVTDVFDYVRPLTVENTSGRGFSGFRLKIASDSWIDFNNSGGKFRINADQSPGAEFEVQANGNAIVTGTMTATNFIQSSDRNAKQNIEAIDHLTVLAKVMDLPISEWSYKDTPASRHIGPMAQDFYKSFGLGDTDKGITSIDAGGVALAAIQGVKKEKDQQIAGLIADKDAEIGALRAEFELLRSRQDERILQLEMALMELLRKQSDEEQLGLVE